MSPKDVSATLDLYQRHIFSVNFCIWFTKYRDFLPMVSYAQSICLKRQIREGCIRDNSNDNDIYPYIYRFTVKSHSLFSPCGDNVFKV